MLTPQAYRQRILVLTATVAAKAIGQMVQNVRETPSLARFGYLRKVAELFGEPCSVTESWYTGNGPGGAVTVHLCCEGFCRVTGSWLASNETPGTLVLDSISVKVQSEFGQFGLIFTGETIVGEDGQLNILAEADAFSKVT